MKGEKEDLKRRYKGRRRGGLCLGYYWTGQLWVSTILSLAKGKGIYLVAVHIAV